MKKRGMLLAEETLKIIIALICLTFLVYFLTMLYFNSLNEKKIEQANQELAGSSESFKSIIENLGEGETKNKKLTSPSGWFLFSFTNEKPNSCAGQSCICICDEAYFYQNQAEVCTKKGACLPNKDITEFNQIEIDPNRNIDVSISKTNGEIKISQ